MRILFLSSEFPPGPGGIGAHAHNLAHQLIVHNYQVVVYTAARSDYPSHTFDGAQQATIIRYSAYSKSVVRLVHLVKHVWKYRKGCDWIILSGLTNLALFSIIRILLKSKILGLVHGHEIVMAKGVTGFLVRRALLRTDHIVAVSEFAKGILRDNGIVRPVTTIPNGVNLPEKTSVRRLNPNKLVLITVGSVTKRKGQHNVIAALPGIVERFGHVEYHVVGIPRQKEEIETLAQKLGVSNQIFLHGALNDEQRDALMLQADIFMMLSENLPDGDVEGFGIAVLEANGFGLPAIGSKDTGVEQAIDHGRSGYLVDAKDPERICDAIGDILNHYEKFSTSAIAWAQQHDWRRIGKMYLDILKEN
ncbi:MAG: glycosyltransferase family 4 protein [Cyclobacteriaceae bacterium]|nr:glycosyltransferase family 4 protein [Cyclobacteriaceae bacterium]